MQRAVISIIQCLEKEIGSNGENAAIDIYATYPAALITWWTLSEEESLSSKKAIVDRLYARMDPLNKNIYRKALINALQKNESLYAFLSATELRTLFESIEEEEERKELIIHCLEWELPLKRVHDAIESVYSEYRGALIVWLAIKSEDLVSKKELADRIYSKMDPYGKAEYGTDLLDAMNRNDAIPLELLPESLAQRAIDEMLAKMVAPEGMEYKHHLFSRIHSAKNDQKAAYIFKFVHLSEEDLAFSFNNHDRMGDPLTCPHCLNAYKKLTTDEKAKFFMKINLDAFLGRIEPFYQYEASRDYNGELGQYGLFWKYYDLYPSNIKDQYFKQIIPNRFSPKAFCHMLLILNEAPRLHLLNSLKNDQFVAARDYFFLALNQKEKMDRRTAVAIQNFYKIQQGLPASNPEAAANALIATWNEKAEEFLKQSEEKEG